MGVQHSGTYLNQSLLTLHALSIMNRKQLSPWILTGATFGAKQVLYIGFSEFLFFAENSPLLLLEVSGENSVTFHPFIIRNID